MFRSAMLTTAAALGLGALVAAPSAVQAHPPIVYPVPVVVPAYYPPPPPIVVQTYSPVVVEPCRRYEVVYRTCAWEPYRVYGTYASERHAHEAARSLRHSGYHARIEVIR